MSPNVRNKNGTKKRRRGLDCSYHKTIFKRALRNPMGDGCVLAICNELLQSLAGTIHGPWGYDSNKLPPRSFAACSERAAFTREFLKNKILGRGANQWIVDNSSEPPWTFGLQPPIPNKRATST